ncbi:MAG: hypothetical protein ACKVJD_12985 [Burkholderiales bacterium]
MGAINERYEALCDVCLYVCMSLELSANYGQTVRVFVFFHKTEWVYMVLRILNLEEQQNCMIGSKVTAILSPFFSKISKTSNIGMWGVNPEAID